MKGIINKIFNWETWPFKVIYAPLTLVWLWYTIKSGSIWFFTSSNPKITFGGMDGEPKMEMYNLLPLDLYPTTFFVQPHQDFKNILENLQKSNIEYPFIVKPDIAKQGVLFRKIENETELKYYHTNVPMDYIIQEMVHYPMEVSVFYIRHPKENKGTITGFLHKIPLQIEGDRIHTLHQLIIEHPKGQKYIDQLQIKHQDNWERVLEKGEKYMLSYAANHNRGAHFIDLKEHIDKKLVNVFDKISLGINDFFYGRYDIMCSNVEDLKNGKNFKILEYNGCGAEPNHFYDTGYTLIGAYKEILKHWKALYKICKYNRQQGIAPWPFMKGRKFWKQAEENFLILKAIDEKLV